MRKLRVHVNGEWRIVDRIDALKAGLNETDLREIPPYIRDRDARHVQLTETWVEAPIGEDWTAAYRIVVQDGGLVVGEIRLFPAESTDRRDRSPGQWCGEFLGIRAPVPPGGISADTLRRVRASEPLRIGAEILEKMRKEDPKLVDFMLTGSPRWTPRLEIRMPLAPLPAGGNRRGPKGRPESFYAELASEYLAAWESGSRSPAGDVAKRRKLPPGRLRDMLHQARRRGLLISSAGGRRGGVLSERARALLAAPKQVVKTARSPKRRK